MDLREKTASADTEPVRHLRLVSPQPQTRSAEVQGSIAELKAPDLRLIQGSKAPSVPAPSRESYADLLIDTFPGMFPSLKELQQAMRTRLGIDSNGPIPSQAYLDWMGMLPGRNDFQRSHPTAQENIKRIVQSLCIEFERRPMSLASREVLRVASAYLAAL